MQLNPKKIWTRPEATPLTDTGSRSDTPDVAARNAAGPIGSDT